MKLCAIDGCFRKYKGNGFCELHNNRWKKSGDPLKRYSIDKPDSYDIDRFYSKTILNEKTRCLEWIGSKIPKGYGQFRFNGKSRRAHRFIYEFHHGVIPDGMLVLHKCDNPSCCEISHLFLGTNDENMKDMVNKGRSWKPKGELSPFTKLTDAIVKEIKKDIFAGMINKEIQEKYDVSQTVVSLIKNNKTWTHVVI